MSPGEAGGVPDTMPTNDWWKNAVDKGLETIKDIQLAKINARPAGLPPISSNVNNPAPGTQGVNPQASATPGGARQPFSFQLESGAGLIIGVAIVALVLAVALHHKG